MKATNLNIPKLYTATLTSKSHETYPFTQQPSENQFPAARPTNNSQDSPSELFSRFTADVIKKDVIFTR